MGGKKRILIVTGSYPPDVCGVGDYTAKLITCLRELSRHSFDISIFYKNKWSVFKLHQYLKEIRKLQCDIVHMQYPAQGYAYSLVPLFLCMFLARKKLVITVHEFSKRTMKAKIYTACLIVFAGCIIVTNEEEKSFLRQFHFFKRKKLKVIPIGSNIPISPHKDRSLVDRTLDVGYFGHIRPSKGIEDFICAVRDLSLRVDNAKYVIVGQTLDSYSEYFEEIQKQAAGLPIRFIINKESWEVSDILSDIKVMFLPFPDGVSSRRGTLIASALNGTQIVSYYSNNVSNNEMLSKACYLCKDRKNAVPLLFELIHFNLPQKDLNYLTKLFSWDNIVDAHGLVYKQLLYR